MHRGMLTARKQCNAHAAYSKCRSAQELLETFGLLDPEPRDKIVHNQLDSDSNTKPSNDYESFLTSYRQKTGLPPLGSVASIPRSLPIDEAKANVVNHEGSGVFKHMHTLRLQLERQNVVMREKFERQIEDLRMQLQRQDGRHKEEIGKLQRMMQMHNDKKAK